jgi:hypothetical protein
LSVLGPNQTPQLQFLSASIRPKDNGKIFLFRI